MFTPSPESCLISSHSKTINWFYIILSCSSHVGGHQRCSKFLSQFKLTPLQASSWCLPRCKYFPTYVCVCQELRCYLTQWDLNRMLELPHHWVDCSVSMTHCLVLMVFMCTAGIRGCGNAEKKKKKEGIVHWEPSTGLCSYIRQLMPMKNTKLPWGKEPSSAAFLLPPASSSKSLVSDKSSVHLGACTLMAPRHHKILHTQALKMSLEANLNLGLILNLGIVSDQLISAFLHTI